MAYMWLNGVPVALLLAFISMEITLFSAGTVSYDTCTPGCKKAKALLFCIHTCRHQAQ